MKAKRTQDLAVLLATFGSAVLAIAALKELIDHFTTLSWAYKSMLIAGIAALVASFAALGFSLILQAVSSASAVVIRSEYTIAMISADQLQGYHGFCRSVIGDGVASLDRVRDWYAKNPETLWAVRREQRRGLKQKSEMVGFFSVFPVTQEAKELLAKNLHKGTELVSNHIVSQGHRAAAIYIGAVGAKGFRAKERTLGALMGYLISRTRKTPLIFTRPVTKDGLRLTRQQGFEPVLKAAALSQSDEEDMIFVRNFAG